jgi:hypothetical protein
MLVGYPVSANIYEGRRVSKCAAVHPELQRGELTFYCLSGAETRYFYKTNKCYYAEYV